MKDLLGKWKGLKAETRRFLKFLAIPLVVVILMMVVVALDKTEQASKEPETTLQETVSTSSESTLGQPEQLNVTLEKDAVPELKDLMEAYLNARKTCDLEALSTVYGGLSSKEDLEQQIAKMEEEVKFYQSFDGLECFTTKGLLDGEYVVYAKFNVKFRQAETTAPSLIVCYAKADADGNYYLVADNSKEESDLMETVNQSDEVQKLAKEVNEGLEKALKSDDNLLAVYHTLMNGDTEPKDAEESTSESNNN